MNSGELLETSHAPEPEHCPLSSSEWQVRILRSIFEPPTGFLTGACANVAQGGSIGSELISNNLFGSAILTHCLLWEFQCGLLVAGFCDEALENFALVVDCPPKVMRLAIDLHKHLIKVPTPAAGLHTLGPALSDFGSELGAKSMPPVPNGLVANIDAAFMQQIFHIAERQREPDVQHHRQADDLWARFEIAKRRRLGHERTLPTTLPRLKSSYSDKTLVLKYLIEAGLVIPKRYATALPRSSQPLLIMLWPLVVKNRIVFHQSSSWER